MRPISSPQDIIQHPLNHVFGVESHVRILRALSETDSPLAAADLAARTGISNPGTHKALDRLVDTGFVQQVGGGRAQQYAMRRHGALAEAILRLFEAERERHRGIVRGLREAAQSTLPPARSIWLEPGDGHLGEPLVVVAVHDARHIDDYLATLRRRLSELERSEDLTIELRGMTAADTAESEPGEDITLLAGAPPAQLRTKPAATNRTHADHDQRSRNRMEALAVMIREDPSLVERARRHLEGLLSTDRGTATADLREWETILRTYSIARLARFLVSDEERALRLRQSAPFLAVLKPRERQRIDTPPRGSR